MKKFLVTFVLSDNGKYFHEDHVGLDVYADDIDDLAKNLQRDIDMPDESISDRITRVVEENIGGLQFDTYRPISIGQYNEDGDAMVLRNIKTLEEW
ncbi:MAG: hypothetical protein VYD29_03555 [Pseudomonadota bacterium]|nr:hypothetical protein [Pseudomonadota bacterium]